MCKLFVCVWVSEWGGVGCICVLACVFARVCHVFVFVCMCQCDADTHPDF